MRVEPYLAAYAQKKFESDPVTGGIKIPDTFDLYHCVWQLMERRPRLTVDREDANLAIWLPFRRTMPSKHPEHWNYIPPRRQWIIEKQLRRLFNWELHHYVEQQQEYGRTRIDAIREFIRYYDLPLDCEQALVKHLQRHERTMKVFLNITKSKKEKNR